MPIGTRPEHPGAGGPPSGTPLSGTPLSGAPPSGTPPSGEPPSGTPPSGGPPSGTPPSGEPPSGEPPSGDVDWGGPPGGLGSAPPPQVQPIQHVKTRIADARTALCCLRLPLASNATAIRSPKAIQN